VAAGLANNGDLIVIVSGWIIKNYSGREKTDSRLMGLSFFQWWLYMGSFQLAIPVQKIFF